MGRARRNGSPRESIGGGVTTVQWHSGERGSTVMAPRASTSLDGAPRSVHEKGEAMRWVGIGE
jgi:hypothetical protein